MYLGSKARMCVIIWSCTDADAGSIDMVVVMVVVGRMRPLFLVVADSLSIIGGRLHKENGSRRSQNDDSSLFLFSNLLTTRS